MTEFWREHARRELRLHGNRDYREVEWPTRPEWLVFAQRHIYLCVTSYIVFVERPDGQSGNSPWLWLGYEISDRIAATYAGEHADLLNYPIEAALARQPSSGNPSVPNATDGKASRR